MSQNISAFAFSGKEQYSILVDRFPEACPICHHAIDPRLLGAFFTDVAHDSVEHGFQCPREACRSLFIGYYERFANVWDYQRVRPTTAKVEEFATEVTDVSPTFAEVYNQAVEAESHDLDQIAGIGFRKALEFLVKDFAIRQHAADAENIRKMPLAGVIKQYLEDPLKSTALRATWLGNDEAHYIRKWDGKDITDLKRLIKLTVNWVESTLLTAKYIEDMPE